MITSGKDVILHGLLNMSPVSFRHNYYGRHSRHRYICTRCVSRLSVLVASYPGRLLALSTLYPKKLRRGRPGYKASVVARATLT